MSQPSHEVSRRYRQTPKGKYRSYKSNAQQRGIEFKISFESFVAFWGANCFYRNHKIHTIGLDRIDNTKGYIPGNVRSCCKWCNAAKSNLTQAHFFDLCRQVVRTHALL